MKLAAVTLVLGLFVTFQAPAQQPPVKSVTTGVVVDVTVVDANGQPVLDIAPEEFEVSEDGKRQRIVSATLVHGGVVRPVKDASAAASNASQTAPPDSTAITPASQPARTPSVTAILFDRLSPESRDMARRA